jgi:transposase
MYCDYPDLISESPEQLAKRERQHRSSPVGDRLKMLRLLKEGTYRSRRKLAGVLGYSERQLKRWFDAYREGGLAALLERKAPGGRAEAVTPEAWAGLEEEMKAGRIARLEDARRYLADVHGVQYAGISSISALFKRRGVKLKTGRLRHRKADPEKQQAFKK